MIKKYAFHIPLFCLNAAILVFLLLGGPEIQPDTATYLNNSILRAPLLPLLIDFCQFLFGNNGLAAVAAFQVLFTTGALIILALALVRHFGTSLLQAHVVFTLFQALLLKFGNSILTEPLSFGLHALFMAALIAHIFTKNARFLLYMIGIATLEMLMRPQFFYVFVFLVLYSLFMLIMERKKEFAIAVMAIVMVWGGLFFVRNTYNEAHSGVYGQYSAIGEHLLATQLYIASPDIISLFEDDKDREFIRRLLKRLDERELSIHHWDYTKSHYNKSITKIYFQNILPVYLEIFPDTRPQAQIERDAYCKRLGIILLQKNLVPYAKLLLLKLYHGPFNFLCLYAVLSLLALTWYWKTRSEHALLYVAISTLTLLNYGMLFPFALVVKRYTMFSDTYQILFTALCGLLFLSRVDRPTDTNP